MPSPATLARSISTAYVDTGRGPAHASVRRRSRDICITIVLASCAKIDGQTRKGGFDGVAGAPRLGVAGQVAHPDGSRLLRGDESRKDLTKMRSTVRRRPVHLSEPHDQAWLVAVPIERLPRVRQHVADSRDLAEQLVDAGKKLARDSFGPAGRTFTSRSRWPGRRALPAP